MSLVVQMLRGVQLLHSHNMAHRDISLENILLRRQTLKLMDFGQTVQIRAATDGQELRYFRMCGKDYYRAPEVYMPAGMLQVPVQRPSGCALGAVVQMRFSGYFCNVCFPTDHEPEQAASAQLCGYTAAPVDLFSCGVVFFTLHTRAPPWQAALLQDRGFAFVFQNGLGAMLSAWKKPLSQ